ncbi:hypothetical protein BKA70DRAFT_829633 [Coprinopsis sp. MPI-PUGE-AT-0042]|nr:hypothetical protein BKA70DRAFT_829633 [Coprinopsis sp. MPI-PUGE-AT-0042]
MHRHRKDLKAVLLFDPENAEAKALLNARSLAIEQLIPDSEAAFRSASGIIPRQLERVSMEIWREIALFLPRRDLKTLLFVPHILSRVASQLLFRELDLHFSSSDAGMGESDDEGVGGPGGSSGLIAGGLVGLSSMGMGMGGAGGIVASSHPTTGMPSSYTLYEERERDEGRHAQRTADILTRLIVDQKFGSAVRTLKIFCSSRRDRDGSMAFQTGMLTNVLPKLVNLKNVYLSATSESIIRVLRILQVTGTKLHGLSLHSPDAPADLSFLEIRNLSHFSYTTSGGTLSSLSPLFTSNQPTMSSLSLENLHPSPHWTFPAATISVRNLLSLNFTGHFGKDHGAAIMGEILREGRQLETLTIVCCSLESSGLSREFRNASFGWGAGVMAGPPGDGSSAAMNPFGGSSLSLSMNTNGTPVALPFLRNFAFTVASLGRRTADRDLFPSIAEFLRGRRRLRSLRLIASCDEHSNDVQSMQSAVGFEAAVWGVLPSLEGLKALGITYPADLSAGLACWLIPRTVKALTLSVDYGSPFMRDPVNWLNALRHGVPPNLKFIGLSELNIRHATEIVDRGFPMVRVVRVGQNYWTVHRRKMASYSSSPPMALPPARALPALAPAGHGHFPASSSPRASTSHQPSTSTPYAPATRSGSPSSTAPTPSRGDIRSPSGGVQSERLTALARPATHTGHPHSGHTHGHPGSSNPHPPHQLGASPAPPGHYMASSGASPSTGSGHHGGYASGGIMGAGILHSSSSAGPPHRSPASTAGGSSVAQERGGCLLSSGGGPSSGPSGPGTMTELELWPRRRVLYHAAEWLEWLGCEDALVRDTSAYPAWTMCM